MKITLKLAVRYRSICVSLTSITDFRLAKATLALDVSDVFKPLKTRNTEISDLLFAGHTKLAAQAARRVLRSPDGVDPWQFIYAGFAFAHVTRPRVRELRRPQDIFRLIAMISSMVKGSEGSFAQLSKLVANLRGLPTVAGLVDMLALLQRSRPDDPWRPWLIGMNSPTIGVEDMFPKTAGSIVDLAVTPARELGPTEATWRCFHGAGHGSVGARLVATDEKVVHEPLRALASSMLLHAHFALGNRQDVIALIADEGARGEAYRRLLPVVPSLGNYKWVDYKTVPAPLVSPIALHLLWIAKENDATASLLRFAVGEFLRTSGLQRPSKLFDHANEYVMHQLIYFLRDVCVPHILDVSRALKSSAVISVLRPRLIAMCGICAGVRGKVNVGDVLFADPAWDFQSGKRVCDKTSTAFSISPHQLYPPAIVRTHAEQLRAESQALAKISTDYGSDAPGLSRVVIGPVASGSAVLADGQIINEIKAQHRELIGVEMEIYGMYAAAYSASKPQPLPFALKAVCDFADPDKENKDQRYAAYASVVSLK